jgi:hypothetical protein
VLLKCVRPFGNKQPGDTVDVPNGAEFDQMYFELAETPAPLAKPNKEEKTDGGN